MVIVGVTGGTGYIGGRLVQRLLASGADVRVVDDRSGPVDSQASGQEVLRADFSSPGSLKSLSDCDVILHLAARSGVVACAQDPEGTRLVNVEGTRRLVGLARERAIPLAFASSFAVVGVPEQLPITEAAAANPPHAYAVQKSRGEDIVRTLSDGGGTLGAVLRMSNLYGSYRVDGRRLAKGNVLNLYAVEARAGRTLKIFAPGTQLRDFIHIEDVCAHWEGVLRFFTRPGRPVDVPTFNVASGDAITVIEAATQVAGAWNRLNPSSPKLEVEIIENPRADVEILQGEFAVDASWTRRTLGVSPGVKLPDGIQRLLQDVRSK